MSKQNLRWQIDLLESRLEKETKIKRAQYAAKKLNEKEGEVDKDDLGRKVVELKQRLVNRKIHHGTTHIQKALKQAIRMEELRLQKRAKKNDKESVRKEMEEITLMKPSDLAPVVVIMQLKKNFMATKTTRENPPEFLSSIIVEDVRSASHDLNHYQQNILARLLKVNGVATVCSDMVRSIKNAIGDTIEVGLDQREGEDRHGVEKEMANKKAQEAESDDDEKYAEFDGMVAGSDDENGNDSEDSDDAKDPMEVSDVDEGEDMEQDVEIKEEEDEEEEEEHKKPQFDSFFLNNVGYVSGSDDEEADKDEVVQQATKVRKNRRGQRARRAIWELKYGKNAKHVQQQRQEEQEKWRRRQERAQKREQYQQRFDDQRNSRFAEKAAEKKQFDDAPLHPSWEAKKKIAAAKFSGKKVVFE
ncbi:bud site selection protein 22 [Trichomonascus vanleenenianus]|uniref:Bud22p n=1 Tax=Trichomonascus vanleenenianus TaxID=2268995 RepID=UPI003ECA7BA8